MATKLDKEQLRELVEPNWRRMYNFVFRLTLDRDRAERYLADVFALAAAQDKIPTENVEVWLLGIANKLLEERLPRQPEVNFDILDETLRSESTRTDVVRSLSDPQRDFLLWELKQGCMTSVVNCLPPGERAAFVVCHVLKLGDDVIKKYDTRSLRALFCTSAPLPGPDSDKAMELFGDIVFNLYGSTETGIVTLAHPEDLKQSPGTIGRAVADNEIRLLDDAGNEVRDGEVGELYARNAMLVAG